MEFDFDVNKVLPLEITLIRSKDIDGGKGIGYHNINKGKTNHHLIRIIDDMGAASSRAQNLRGVITSALKLKSSDHRLYLLRESNANNGLGSVLGMIKVGSKHLYLLDYYGQQHKCHPLCVLDFYVHESKQRNGFGKKLFNYMLSSEQVHPHELAIDKPSAKFTNFLARHYSLNKPIQQVNNFLVFDLFFQDPNVVGVTDNKSRRSAPVRRLMSRQETQRCASVNSLNGVHVKNLTLCGRSAGIPSVLPASSSRISLLPPIEGNRPHNCDSSSLCTTQVVNKSPHSSQSEIQLRDFSRHSVQKSCRSEGGSISCKKKTGNTSSAPKNVQFRNTPEVYTIPPASPMSGQPSSVHITNLSKETPCFSSESFPRVESSATNVNENYTLDKVIARMKQNNQKLGTSWNVLGVPSNNWFSSTRFGAL